MELWREDSWEQFARDAVEAEAYSRRLGKRITEGYAAKFRRLGDQAGNAPWGFRRVDRRLEPDPDTIGSVVRAFLQFATGNVPMQQLALEFDVGVEQVRKALRNPLYNGWATRHRGRERVPAPWRGDPPVSDDLWARVQEVRRQRSRGGCAPGKWRRGIDLLGGPLYCPCGARVRTNGTGGTPPRRRRLHPGDQCDAWGGPFQVWSSQHDGPIGVQVSGIRLDNATIERLVRALAEPEPVALASIDVARIERHKRELALDHAAGRIEDAAYLERMAELRKAVPTQTISTGVPAGEALSYLRNIDAAWKAPISDAARAELLHAIYERIVVTRDGFVEVTLTPHAYRHGLALALPESVMVHKRPRQESVTAMQTRQLVRIGGKREWETAARKSA